MGQILLDFVLYYELDNDWILFTYRIYWILEGVTGFYYLVHKCICESELKAYFYFKLKTSRLQV